MQPVDDGTGVVVSVVEDAGFSDDVLDDGVKLGGVGGAWRGFDEDKLFSARFSP